MNPFTYSYPVKVYFGEKAAQQHLPAELTTLLTDDEMAPIGQKDLGHREIINHFDPQLVKMLCTVKIHE